jgi:ATP-dependent DNA helicase RecG
MPATNDLATIAITQLKGVGAKQAALLAKLGIATLQDLLFHLPLRYQDRTHVTPIGALFPGSEALIEGEVRVCDIVFGKRRSLMARVQDNTGIITLRFYHFNAAQKQQLSPGARVRCYGETRRGASGVEMYHPEYRVVDADTPLPVNEALTPIYPTTEGVTQPALRKLMAQALKYLETHPPADLIPQAATPSLPKSAAVMSLTEALHFLHTPPPRADTRQIRDGRHPAQQRLVLEELAAHQLSMLQLRQSMRTHDAPVLKGKGNLVQQLQQRFGFTLTSAQQRVTTEISNDLAQRQPMLRLVQGDVGSGKTAVAALACAQCVAAGFQAVMMAPTEILAEQHVIAFRSWLEPLGVPVAWLAGKVKGKAREAQLQTIADGSAQVVIGTHALFQADVEFFKLGLAIIDEQHRFGVQQRLALRDKGKAAGFVPHQLIMTATPIPRTLAMSAYADLDLSVIDELPPGRTPIKTVVLDDSRRDAVISRVQNVVAQGRQVYWVCTLIEESEALQCQAAEDTAQQLQAALPQLRVGLVHGRLKPTEKADIMAAFTAGEIDLLVATTVIEVGVNVPNASLMIIDNAERLGLAQLHQLRGRVGRGNYESFCVLLYTNPLSQNGKARLGVMRDTNDGFLIAEKDLELRGAGELLGTRQTGLAQFRIADLARDAALLPAARDIADLVLRERPQHVALLIARWVGQGMKFAQA